MKNLFTNVVLLVALSIAFSSFTACTNTASTKADNTAKPSADKDTTASKKIDAPPAVLQTAIKTLDGNNFKVEDKKGKVVLLNLWATWCGPCRAEMPDLIALQDKYRDNDFEIIGLNTSNESSEEIKSFAEKMKLNYTLAWTDDKLMSALMSISKFNGIPQSYLIDREGKLRGVFVGGGANVIGQVKETVNKVVTE